MRPSSYRIYVTEIPNQVIKPAIEVIFWNQVKTLPEPLLMPMYARHENSEQKMIAGRGIPLPVVRRKIRGALPEADRPSRGFYRVKFQK